MTQFLWVIYPYLALMILIVGTFARFYFRPIAWGSKSSEMLEKKQLRVGSIMFHYGILAVLGGHIMGIIIPLAFYHAIGLPDEIYHKFAGIAGGLAGVVTEIGVIILLVRRIGNRRVRINSDVGDFVSLWALLIVIALGTSQTFTSLLSNPYDYRPTVGPWFRGLITLHPDSSLMASVPLLLQIHILSTFILYAIMPFTRFVHIWSFPWKFLFRAPIQYRSRIRYRKAPVGPRD
jgi:nitrate reductase gamma subunit